MDDEQLESQLSGLFSDFVIPEPEPQPTPDEPRRRQPLTEPPQAGIVLATPALKPEVAPALPRQPLARAEVVPVFQIEGNTTYTPSDSPFLTHLENLLIVLVLALGYLLVIGLAEMVIRSGDLRLGIALHSLILLALFLYAIFRKDAKVTLLCLAVMLIPLIRIVGLFAPLGQLSLGTTALIMLSVLLVALGLVVYYLVSHLGKRGLGR
jgi:hypothetical protein